MVGDRLYTDMAMAKAAGIVGILVLSGETQLKDLEHSQVQPDLVLENLGEIVEALS
jgi:ribonucleotide monophosphatase NagD (HAD superfamily)